MKKIITVSILAFILFACTNATNDAGTDNAVDTSVIGSDNPNPLPDTIRTDSITDSVKNK